MEDQIKKSEERQTLTEDLPAYGLSHKELRRIEEQSRRNTKGANHLMEDEDEDEDEDELY